MAINRFTADRNGNPKDRVCPRSLSYASTINLVLGPYDVFGTPRVSDRARRENGYRYDYEFGTTEKRVK